MQNPTDACYESSDNEFELSDSIDSPEPDSRCNRRRRIEDMLEEKSLRSELDNYYDFDDDTSVTVSRYSQSDTNNDY